MANFPFDLAPFIIPGHHAIEVEGRPARIRVIHGELMPRNEDLAIVTITPMPQGEVAFENVREIVDEFLRIEKRIAIKDITSALLVKNLFVSRVWRTGTSWFPGVRAFVLVFEKHNEGLNWRHFNPNCEVWLQIVGFPADLRCMHEIANSVHGFGKLLVWDRVKTTDASVVVKEDLIGGGPPDEEPIPADDVPNPRPAEECVHPNQGNHFVAHVPLHEVVVADPPINNAAVGNQMQMQQIHIDIEHQIEDNMQEWDHWALPPPQGFKDMEINAGEFPMQHVIEEPAIAQDPALEEEDSSYLTLTLDLPDNRENYVDSVNRNIQIHQVQPEPMIVP
ncbi:unnamed protein product [Alopecurus aequalis]